MKELEKTNRKELLRFMRTPEFDYHISQQIKLDNLKKIQQYIEVGFLDLLTIKEKDEYCMNIGMKNSKRLIKKIEL